MAVSSHRRALVPALVAALALALTGCWPVPGGNAGRTAHNPFETAFTPETVEALEPAWVVDLGPGSPGPLVVDRGAVFVRVGSTVSRLDVGTGATAWTWGLPDDVPDIASVGDPLVVDGRVLVGYGFGNLGGHWFGAALDPASGDPVAGGVASGLLRTARGSIVASDYFSFGTGTPVLVGYFLTDVSGATPVNGGRLSIETGGGGSSQLTIGSAAVYHAGNGPLPDPSGITVGAGLRRFSLQPAGTCGPSGAEVFACPDWATPMVTTTPVVVGPGEQTLYVGVAAGSVAAVDATTGAVLWSTPAGARVTGAPALADGVLYVPKADGTIQAFDAAGCGAATCPPRWSAPVDGTPLAGQPAVSGVGENAVVFAGTQGGTVAAVAAAGCGDATCALLWQASVGASVVSSPAVSNGTVVVGTSAGRIAAFRVPPA